MKTFSHIVLCVALSMAGARAQTGNNDAVQASSFQFGSNAGRVAEASLLAAGAVMGAQAAGYDSLFGRGGTGLLNSNDYLRIGYGWNNNIQQTVFRIAVGSKNAFIHWHLDLW
jgi:hypothetical protein